jgi:hypothetical protein
MKARIRIILSQFFLITCILKTQGQTVKCDSGKVEYIQDSKITDLMNQSQTINEKKDGKVKGYRVQIHFGSDRDKADEIKLKFTQKYTSVTAYEPYEQPNFKVRVGDFRTRVEAYKFLKEITADFPSSFIVQDEVELKELIK